MARYNRIFAALDGGDTQEAVARRTLSIAHDNNAEVLFGHVIDSSVFETGGVRRKEISEANKEAIEKALSRYLNRASKDECIPSVEVQVCVGRVEEMNLEKHTVRVRISMFGRETPVEIEFAQVVRV